MSQYIKLERGSDELKDIDCPHCNQSLKILVVNSKEFEVMKSLKSFNTNVRCADCGFSFWVRLNDNTWISSKSPKA